MKPVLYHFHGLGRFDFSSMAPGDLAELNQLAVERNVEVVPTIYLERSRLLWLEDLCAELRRAMGQGEIPNILGLAVEGPLLGPNGGIPRSGAWIPTVEDWRRIAALGNGVLRYIVMAPDAMDLAEEIEPGFRFSDLIDLLYGNDVRVAIGHFAHDARDGGDPRDSAERTERVVEYIHGRYVSDPNLVLTDHLYNDMPRNFVHAWRTAAAAERRSAELAPVTEADWNCADLEVLLGPVPAVMLDLARRGLIMPCINLDGQHVDLAITKKTFEYLTADRLIALTDHTEVDWIADEKLTLADSGLWLRDDGRVAAGSSGPGRQIDNARSIGLDSEQIAAVFERNPRKAIHFSPVARRTPFLPRVPLLTGGS